MEESPSWVRLNSAVSRAIILLADLSMISRGDAVGVGCGVEVAAGAEAHPKIHTCASTSRPEINESLQGVTGPVFTRCAPSAVLSVQLVLAHE